MSNEVATSQKQFSELSKINVNEHTEKKGNLTYLSWAWAVDALMNADPLATWEFQDPKNFGQTVMVYCRVTALGKSIPMHLPVMDNRNNSIPNPDSRKISDAMMRCLTKCIACFGIGLYIYAGEDVPKDDDGGSDSGAPPVNNGSWSMKQFQPTDEEAGENPNPEYRVSFGQWKMRSIPEILRQFPQDKISKYLETLEMYVREGKYPNNHGLFKDFIERMSDALAALENGNMEA